MDPNLSTLERAFQLAETGRCRTVSEVKMQLSEEGYRAEQVSGPELCKQIAEIFEKASAAA